MSERTGTAEDVLKMSTRPPVFTWSEDLHFGPPSEPVHIRKFLEEAETLSHRGLSPWMDVSIQGPSKDVGDNAIDGWKEWQELSEEARTSVEMECNLDDLKGRLNSTLKSFKQLSYIQRTHNSAIGEISPPGIKKGKETKPRDDMEIEPLKHAIERTPLKMWRLKHAAQPYVRTSHVSDQNALVIPQLKSPGTTPFLSHEVLITLTAYTRNTWYPYAFSRTCQHVLPSACTLTDLWNCISCNFKGDGSMPKEEFEFADDDSDGMQRRGRVVGYEFVDGQLDQGSAVIVIEDTAYCDGRGSPDYVDKLFAHLDLVKAPPGSDAPSSLPLGPYEPPKRSTPLRKGPPFHAVPLRALTLRINEPYWVLHRGNCEHWFVVDEIRLQNPRDPPSGYPVAIQRTPTFRRLCRVCTKVPATLSIINDVRLGESPSMLCQPCWELFGGPPPPKQDDELNARVVVVPMAIEAL